MASQIAHIIYAKKYFDSLELAKPENISSEENLLVSKREINKDEFILGTVFPDIRRIDENIKRQDTHLYFSSLNLDFSGLSSFEAGWKFHLYCDMRREDILNKRSFYKLKDATEFYGQPAKMLEDEIAYNDYNNWEKITYLFNNAPFIKTKLNISQESYKLWYAMLAKYIEKKPDGKSIKIFLSKHRGFKDTSSGVANMVTKLKDNKKVLEILHEIKEKIV